MSRKLDSNLRPSALEFSGYFNILDSEADDGSDVLRTTETLPPLLFDEKRLVYREALDWFNEVASQHREADEIPLGEEELFVCDPSDDRTLCVEIPDFTPWNRDLLLRFQQEFVSRHPNWRVALIGEDAATSIMVYPHVVRIGKSGADSDVDESIKELAAEATALHDARLGPQRRRLKYLQQELPKAVSRIASQPFEIVAVIEKANVSRDRPGIYLLFSGDDRHAFTVEGTGGPDEVWTGSAFAVDASGRIVTKTTTPSSTVFWLTPWFPPPNYRGQLAIVERVTGVRYAYTLQIEDIISDAELTRLTS